MQSMQIVVAVTTLAAYGTTTAFSRARAPNARALTEDGLYAQVRSRSVPDASRPRLQSLRLDSIVRYQVLVPGIIPVNVN